MAIRPFQPGDEVAVRELLFDAFDAGDLPGFTRADLAGVVDGLPGDPEGTLIDAEDGGMLGLYQPHYPLLVVRREVRRRGIGRRLVEAGLDWARRHGESELLLAPPVGSAVALAFCRRLGFRYRSSLWGMELAPDVPVPPPSFPDLIDARPFRPDDDERYVELINTAFAGHPTPLHVTLEIVRQSHRLPGRGPEGVLVLTPLGRPDVLIGFCRTSVAEVDGAPRGTIGQIGVLSEWRGQGLGRELLRWGVLRLRSVAAGPIHLAVEGENERALALYEQSGFQRTAEWPRWSRPV